MTIGNPIELRKAGNRALNAALGHDNAQAFLKLCRGSGDFTKERHEQPEPSHEEAVAGILRLQEERADVIAAKQQAREYGLPLYRAAVCAVAEPSPEYRP
jgi:hypothetical protein